MNPTGRMVPHHWLLITAILALVLVLAASPALAAQARRVPAPTQNEAPIACSPAIETRYLLVYDYQDEIITITLVIINVWEQRGNRSEFKAGFKFYKSPSGLGTTNVPEARNTLDQLHKEILRIDRARSDAVANLQKSIGMMPDSVWGEQTWLALTEEVIKYHGWEIDLAGNKYQAVHVNRLNLPAETLAGVSDPRWDNHRLPGEKILMLPGVRLLPSANRVGGSGEAPSKIRTEAAPTSAPPEAASTGPRNEAVSANAGTEEELEETGPPEVTDRTTSGDADGPGQADESQPDKFDALAAMIWSFGRKIYFSIYIATGVLLAAAALLTFFVIRKAVPAIRQYQIFQDRERRKTIEMFNILAHKLNKMRAGLSRVDHPPQAPPPIDEKKLSRMAEQAAEAAAGRLGDEFEHLSRNVREIRLGLADLNGRIKNAEKAPAGGKESAPDQNHNLQAMFETIHHLLTMIAARLPEKSPPPVEPSPSSRPAERLLILIDDLRREEESRRQVQLKKMGSAVVRFQDLAGAVSMTSDLRRGLDRETAASLGRLENAWWDIEAQYGFRSIALAEIRNLSAERLAGLQDEEAATWAQNCRRDFQDEINSLEKRTVDFDRLGERLDAAARALFNFYQNHRNQLSARLSADRSSTEERNRAYDEAFQKAMKLAGVAEIQVRVNDSFEPNIHESLDAVYFSSPGNGRVREVVRPGYVIRGSGLVLRKVGVSLNTA